MLSADVRRCLPGSTRRAYQRRPNRPRMPLPSYTFEMLRPRISKAWSYVYQTSNLAHRIRRGLPSVSIFRVLGLWIVGRPAAFLMRGRRDIATPGTVTTAFQYDVSRRFKSMIDKLDGDFAAATRAAAVLTAAGAYLGS